MNIREGYKKEMQSIRHDKFIDNKILDEMEKNEQKKSGFIGWQAVVIALACVLIVFISFDSIASYAEGLIGRFHLTAGEEEMRLSEMTPIEVNIEKHKAYEKTHWIEYDSYWCCYENHDLLKEYTGISISESDNLDFKDIMVNIDTTYKTGHLSMDVVFDEGTCHMNGMFIMDGYDRSEYGYGENTKPYYVYEYAEGKKAYFIKDTDAEKMQSVYFSERGIMYQLFVENSEEGRNAGRKIVEYMSE